MRKIIQFVYSILYLGIGIYSDIILYNTGYIYNNNDIKDCNSLWLILLLSSIMYTIIGSYSSFYLIWDYLCNCICYEENNRCNFTCLKFILILCTIILYLTELIFYINQSDECYEVYKKDYKSLWVCFNIQTFGIFISLLGLYLILIIKCKKKCCNKKSEDYYEII